MDDEANQLKPLRAQIAETRAEMGNTIEALHGKLNPTVLKEEAVEKFHEAAETIKTELKEHLSAAKQTLKTEVREQIDAAQAALRDATIGKVQTMMHDAKQSVQNTGRSIIDVVKDNPIPSALIGIGVAWLFASHRRAKRAPAYDSYELTDGTSERGRVSELAHDAGHRIAEGAKGAATAVGHAAQRVGGAASTVAHGVADRARGAKTRAGDYYEVNPIAVGAIALGIGAAVGLAVPITDAESKLMGSARDNLLDKAQDLAHEAMGKAGDAVQQLTDGKQNGTSTQTYG